MSTTWINRGHFYTPHVTPVLVDCNFIVDPTNSNGLGTSSLKGQGVLNVFMHTSSTPAAGPNGYLNPNPANGYILVQLADNYTRFYGKENCWQGPTSTSTKIDNGATLTIGNPYIITIVGDATAAQWRAIGVPAGVTPAIGVSFIAIATGGGSGNTSTSRVQIPTSAGIQFIETVGNENMSLGPVPMGGSPNFGGWLLFRAMSAADSAVTSALTMDSYTPAGTVSGHTHSFTPAGTNANDGPPETFTGTPGTTGSTTPTFSGTPATLTGTIVNSGGALTFAPAAPTALSTIYMSFYLNQSSVLVAGE